MTNPSEKELSIVEAETLLEREVAASLSRDKLREIYGSKIEGVTITPSFIKDHEFIMGKIQKLPTMIDEVSKQGVDEFCLTRFTSEGLEAVSVKQVLRRWGIVWYKKRVVAYSPQVLLALEAINKQGCTGFVSHSGPGTSAYIYVKLR